MERRLADGDALGGERSIGDEELLRAGIQRAAFAVVLGDHPCRRVGSSETVDVPVSSKLIEKFL